VIFGSGTGSIAAFNTLRQLFFAMYVTDVAGVDARIASFVALVGLASDVLLVPRIGVWTDGARTRWGRRRPFLLLGALPAALGFLALWVAPPWESEAARAVHLALAWVIAHTLQSLVVVPYLALVPEIAPGYDDRTALTAWRMLFSIGASLAVAIGAPLVLDAMLAAGLPRPTGHVALAAGFGLLSAVPWLAIGASVRERPPDDAVSQPPPLMALRETWANVPFRYAAAIYLLTWTAFELVALMMPFFLTYRFAQGDLLASIDVFGVPVAAESVVLGTLLVSAMPAVPLWTWVARRFDKKTAFVAGMATWAAAELAMIAVPPGDTALLLALAAFAGAGVATAHVLPDAMLPDAVDYGELLTGRRAEASYYAAQDLLRKLAGGLALFVALQGLGWGGYVAPPEGATTWSVPEGAQLAILVLVGPVGVALLGGAMLAARAYPLTRERQAEVRRELEARRT
jgi:GPH family glycoside/pentoside/hexuronide:cation symporter